MAVSLLRTVIHILAMHQIKISSTAKNLHQDSLKAGPTANMTVLCCTQYSSIFINIHQYLSIFINIHQYSSIFINIYQYLSIFYILYILSFLESGCPCASCRTPWMGDETDCQLPVRFGSRRPTRHETRLKREFICMFATKTQGK